jgi:hypothetical protein
MGAGLSLYKMTFVKFCAAEGDRIFAGSGKIHERQEP